MSAYNAHPHKGTGQQHSTENDHDIKVAGFQPIPHAVHFYVQLNDGNALEEEIRNRQQELNRARGENATKDNPHHIADVNPDWTDGERELGFFSSLTGHGEPNAAGDDLKTRYYDQHIALYKDAKTATKARDSSKTKLVIEPRHHDLYTRDYDRDGNIVGVSPMNWHPGTDGTHYEGTLIKIQASYVEDPWDALERAEWLLEETLGHAPDYDLIPETFRFAQPEVHIRFHRDLLFSATKTLSDTAQLLTFEGGSIEAGDIRSRKGKWDIWGFESSTLEEIGFLKEADWTDNISSEYVKAYMLENPPKDPSNPTHHPKLEAKIHGGFHVSEWNEVLTRANDICLTFADWAGIDAGDVIADDHFTGAASPDTAFKKPIGYREALEEFYTSDELRYTVAGRIFKERSDTYQDILIALAYECHPDGHGNAGTTYDDLEEKTGYSYSALSDRVPDLARDGILEIVHDSVAYITWASDKARSTARDVIAKTGKTAGQLVFGLKERAQKRREDRDAQNGKEVDTEDNLNRDADGYLILSSTGVTMQDVAKWYSDGDIGDDDIKYRPPPS